jgi:hypothetical protein
MYVMLTFELKYALPSEREIFYKHLESGKWTRSDNVSTSWYASFSQDMSKDNNRIGSGMPEKSGQGGYV